jgi:hypothetical protein
LLSLIRRLKAESNFSAIALACCFASVIVRNDTTRMRRRGRSVAVAVNTVDEHPVAIAAVWGWGCGGEDGNDCRKKTINVS